MKIKKVRVIEQYEVRDSIKKIRGAIKVTGQKSLGTFQTVTEAQMNLNGKQKIYKVLIIVQKV